jgi:hypothetical protein
MKHWLLQALFGNASSKLALLAGAGDAGVIRVRA